MRTIRSSMLVAAMAAGMALVACGGGSPDTTPTQGATSAPAATTPPATQPAAGAAAGTWTGTWESDVFDGLSGTFEMTFTQSGNSLSGPITVDNADCITTGTVTGTLAGSQIEFGAVKASTTITYTGTLSGDSMSGTYDSAECGNDKGTWEANRSA